MIHERNKRDKLGNIEVSCERCGRPMMIDKKTSDYSKICFNCLTDDEREDAMSPERQMEYMKKNGLM